jgi:hypothetical protein
LLEELYNDVDLQPPLAILWKAANNQLHDNEGEHVEVGLELRIKAAIAAATFSHSRPPGADNQGAQLPMIAFVAVVEGGDEPPPPPLEVPAQDVGFEDVVEAAD